MSELVLERLRQGPLLCDGAMGTMLYARASASQMHGRCFDELVLTSPELIQRIHREYILAGAQVIETNTFGANAVKLAAYGLGDEVKRINRQAAKLAREAREVAGQAVFVAGAVGPSGQIQIPDLADDEPRLAILRGVFREQIEALMEGGVELLILETFSSIIELRQAVLAAREAGDLPIVAQLTFSEDALTLAGETPEAAARALAGLGVAVIGSNCSRGRRASKMSSSGWRRRYARLRLTPTMNYCSRRSQTPGCLSGSRTASSMARRPPILRTMRVGSPRAASG